MQLADANQVAFVHPSAAIWRPTFWAQDFSIDIFRIHSLAAKVCVFLGSQNDDFISVSLFGAEAIGRFKQRRPTDILINWH